MVALVPVLPTPPPRRRPLARPLGPLGPRSRAIRPRRQRRVGRVHPDPPLEPLDLGQKPRDPRAPLGQRSKQVLTAHIVGSGHRPTISIYTITAVNPQPGEPTPNPKTPVSNRPEWIRLHTDIAEGPWGANTQPRSRPAHCSMPGSRWRYEDE